MQQPDWWEWEIEVSSHCLKRMTERGFYDTDLRAMLDDAEEILEQAHGTFLVTTKLNHRPWEVIVTPDDDQRLVVVVTAYPC